MASENSSAVTVPKDIEAPADAITAGDAKGKGKAVATEEAIPQDTHMGDSDDDDDDEEEEEGDEAGEAEDEDNMEEIDLDNVISRRTRGKVIDFAKAAEENPAQDEDDDEDEDDDFKVDDKMDED